MRHKIIFQYNAKRYEVTPMDFATTMHLMWYLITGHKTKTLRGYLKVEQMRWTAHMDKLQRQLDATRENGYGYKLDGTILMR